MSSLATIQPAYGSEAWVAERRSYVGASDVPAILGLSPFGSAYDVALQKRGLAGADLMTEAQRWGHYHEPAIAAEYQRRFPEVTLEQVGTLPHPKYSWLRATVDRLVHQPTGVVHPLEIKSTSEHLGYAWGDEETDAVPQHVVVQAQVQLMVLGLPFAHAAVLVGHSDCRLPYVIEADRETQEMIVEEVHAFYTRFMLGDELPAITGPNAEQHMRKRYATHSDVVLNLEGAQAELLATFLETYRQRKALEEAEAELKPRIMDLIGQNYGVKCDAGKVIWYATKGRTSIDTKGLIAHLKVPADVVDSFTKIGAASRTFRPMPKGD